MAFPEEQLVMLSAGICSWVLTKALPALPGAGTCEQAPFIPPLSSHGFDSCWTEVFYLHLGSLMRACMLFGEVQLPGIHAWA